jgi:heme/copper-type cytochrome/quinol oxidase subunit 2
MRLVVLTMCMLVAAGVFAAMFLAIWGSRRDHSRAPTFHQTLASEIVWAAIPCLIVLAAAIPATMAILSSASRD